jgi:antitoxin component YwqK of YwqJK toxin-antitoxin module
MKTNINKYNKDNKETGYWEVPDGDGNLWHSGNFEDGNKIGLWNTYNPKGEIISTIDFANKPSNQFKTKLDE